MWNSIEETIDELDACIFTGDPSNIDIPFFRNMMERWGRALDAIEKANKDE